MRKICLLGGTGFVGKELTLQLIKQGWQVKILTRHRESHREFFLFPNVQLVEADLREQSVLNAQLAGCEVVVNLIGILNEAGSDGAGFQRAHVDFPKKIITACQANGVHRVLHLSALNADPKKGSSFYLRSKGEGENLLHNAIGIDVTSFRPSVIFGEHDSFFNRFANLLKIPNYLFFLPSAQARFAPIWVGDLVQAMLLSIDNPKTYGKRYNLCGAKAYTLAELVSYTAKLLGLKRKIIGLDDKWSKRAAELMGKLPNKPYSLDNYLSAQQASVCSENQLAEFGIKPASVESLLPSYLAPFHHKACYDRFRFLAGKTR
ncbi:MAG: complex I NDUFA9 subunit family protein [Thiotrichaceae bacterium]|nr:complex I NDUFA9 subunit family protein [Thiotrichaceae bacterium]